MDGMVVSEENITFRRSSWAQVSETEVWSCLVFVMTGPKRNAYLCKTSLEDQSQSFLLIFFILVAQGLLPIRVAQI